MDARLGKCPHNEGAGRFGRVSATATVGDHAVADLDRASVIWRAVEADVPDDASTVALDDYPDAKALRVPRCGSLATEHTEKIGMRPLCRDPCTKVARRSVPILGQSAGCRCRQGLQLQALGYEPECAHSANLFPTVPQLCALGRRSRTTRSALQVRQSHKPTSRRRGPSSSILLTVKI